MGSKERGSGKKGGLPQGGPGGLYATVKFFYFSIKSEFQELLQSQFFVIYTYKLSFKKRVFKVIKLLIEILKKYNDQIIVFRLI